MRTILGVLSAMLAVTGCATGKDRRPDRLEPSAASARVEGKSGNTLSGTAEFRPVPGGVALTLRVTGAPPGAHAVHLHQVGDCSAGDASSAGEHWNPTQSPHGHLPHSPAHLGDIGNLMVNEAGEGELEFVTEQWTLGTGAMNDANGKALVIHAKEDDLQSQPAGNAGDRIGCGVVQLKKAGPVAQR
jgi:superoxide dismutase, Cu-Zn family